MRTRSRRSERAEGVVAETLRERPFGIPAIALVDALQRGGFQEGEAAEVLEKLRAEGRIAVERGHYRLVD